MYPTLSGGHYESVLVPLSGPVEGVVSTSSGSFSGHLKDCVAVASGAEHYNTWIRVAWPRLSG
jgi:hypothetical protein